jgi:alkylated DNA repair dioxygenase AlkB
MSASSQADLFASQNELPPGMRYMAEALAAEEERALLNALPALRFKEFEFHGFLGKRRTVSFGWRYDFNGGGFQKIDSIPEFLMAARERAANFAGLDAPALEHALVTEYRPGAGIGWHKDRSVFGDVVGISLLAACTFRLRRKIGTRWQRRSFTAEPRSMYLLRGPARTEWEHSIPPLDMLRYSITFRSLAATSGN